MKLLSFIKNKLKRKPIVYVVCGPTATGKSDLAVEIALKKNGEVISADSRQVYIGLDIGSGKITKEEMRGVPHHLLDVANPKNVYTVSDFKSDAEKAIEDIIIRGKTPIICGGTGFYIDTLIYNTPLPEVPPNKELRESLEKMSLEELQQKLKSLDPERFESVDTKNKVRIIRALEIIDHLGKVPTAKRSLRKDWNIKFKYIDRKDEVLKDRIYKRLISRINSGMIEEVENIHEQGVSWERLEDLGLEYKYVAMFLQKKISKEDMVSNLNSQIWKYAKRQRTWFKKYLPKK